MFLLLNNFFWNLKLHKSKYEIDLLTCFQEFSEQQDWNLYQQQIVSSLKESQFRRNVFFLLCDWVGESLSYSTTIFEVSQH